MTPIAAIQLRLARPAAIILAAVILATAQAQPPTPRVDADGDPLPAGALYRLGTKAWRQPGYSPAWSPDGKRLAIVASHQIRILDGESGRLLSSFAAKDENDQIGYCRRAVWSPDGQTLAVRAYPAGILILDSRTGEHRRTHKVEIEDSGDQGPMCFSADGSMVGSTFGTSYAVIDSKTGEVVVSATHESYEPIRCLSFTADASRLIAVNAYGHIDVWELASRRIVKQWAELETKAIRAAAVSPAKNLAAIAASDTLIIIDLAENKVAARLKVAGDPNEALEANFTPDGKQLVLSSEEFEIFDTSDWSSKRRPASDGHERVFHLAIAPDNRRAALVDGNRIFLWNLEAGRLEEPSRPGHDSPVQAVTFSGDGALLATGSDAGRDAGKTHLWEAKNGRHVRTLETTSHRISFVKGNRQICTASYRLPHLRLWNVATGEPVSEWSAEQEGHSGIVPCRDGSYVMILSRPLDRIGYRIDRVTLPSLTSAGQIERERGIFGGLAVSNNGRLAAFGTQSGVELFDFDQEKLIGEFSSPIEHVRPAAFTPDERFLIGLIPAQRGLGVWELASLQAIHKLEGLKQPLTIAALAPGGRVVAVAATRGPLHADADARQIHLWDSRTGKQLASLIGHDTDVSSLAFSEDGALLAGGMSDSTVIVWDVPPDARIAGFERASLSDEDAAALWEQLALPDAKVSQAAVGRLAQDAAAALAIAEQRLEPSQPPPQAQLQQLLKQLDAENFDERQKAAEQLASFGRVIRAELQAAIEQTESVEVRLRCGELLRLMERRYPQKGPRLAETRAVQLLEWIGDERAAALLKRLATGAAEAHLTQEANATLARLAR
jgi:WD40 repeat protein